MPIVATRLLKRPTTSSAPTIIRPEIQPRARVRRVSEPSLSAVASSAPATQPEPAPEPKRDYDVGYGKPPKHTQFPKGQSGNKKGRPKGAKGLKSMARKILTEKVTVKTGRGHMRMTRMEATLHKISEKAFGGDIRAIQAVVQLYQQSVPDEPIRIAGAQASEVDQDAHDAAILAALRQALLDEENDEKNDQDNDAENDDES